MLSDSNICHYIQLQHTITRPKPSTAHQAQAMLGTQRGSAVVEATENPDSIRERLFVHEGKPNSKQNKVLGWC